MEKEKKEKESVPEKQDTALKRIELSKVVLMAPALLSLVKHCQDKKQSTSSAQGLSKNGVMGHIIGYIEEQIEIKETNLKITKAHVQIGPESKQK